MKKRITVALSILLLLALSIVGVFAVTTAAQEEAPTLSLDYANLSFRDSICIKYAVKADGLENVTLLCWTEGQQSYTKGTETRVLHAAGTETIEEVEYLVFDYTGLSAKQMTDEIYVRAYAELDGNAVYSDVRKYSVLEYAYTMLGKLGTYESTNPDLKALLESMLDYGGRAQVYFDYRTDALASEPFYVVKTVGGTLADGTVFGLYPTGASVSLSAPQTREDGATFSYWADATGKKVGTAAECTIALGSANATYSPVYVKYSSGLEFESNGDGTCIILGMGDCTDTELVIPPVSPENDTVVEIDASAFAGEEITSVSFPATLEAIGRRAFNNCTSLTDVYYDGTAEEWEENVYVNTTGNDAILNATMHFNEPAAVTFTVTFVDFDGTVLKTETVESGKGATAPADPTREGYTFTGWDVSFDAVTSDMTVTARYEALPVTEPTFTVESVSAAAGDTVTVAVSVKNNPGILAMAITLTYDESVMTLKSAANGDALSVLTMTPSRTLTSGCKFAWDGVEIAPEDVADGEFLVLTFEVADGAADGEYGISISYNDGDIYDNDLMPLSFDVVNGTLTVS